MEIFDIASRLIGLISLIAILFGTIERQELPWIVRTMCHGLSFGLAAAICMCFPVHLQDGTVVNGRSLFLAFAAAFGGPLPYSIAAVITTFLHLYRGDVTAVQIVYPMVASGFLGLGWRWTVCRRYGYSIPSLAALGVWISLVSLLLIFFSPGHGGQVFVAVYPAIVAVSIVSALIVGLLIDREVRHFADERMWRQEAYSDALTNLSNKRSFQEDYADAMASRSAFSLVLFDVDHFKKVNDTYGHPVGDKVLRAIAGVLAETLLPEAKAYRLGGEEFAVMLRGTDIISATGLANDVRRQVARSHVSEDGGLPPVTLSAGVAASAVDGEHKEVLTAADEALYHAKSSGRDRVSSCVDVLEDRHQVTVHGDSRDRISTDVEISPALENSR